MIHWLIDNGHGAIDPFTCEPVTPGKRSPVFPNGTPFAGQVLIEGVRNRAVVNYLSLLMDQAGFKYSLICDTWRDCPLHVRTEKANLIVRSSKDPKEEFVFLSIHHNAFKNSWNSANGASCHIYPNSKSGKKIGDILQKEIVKSTGLKNRGVKESNFFVLRKTVCPAVLSENGFMTNLDDATFGMSEEGSKKIAEGHFNAIKLIENEKK